MDEIFQSIAKLEMRREHDVRRALGFNEVGLSHTCCAKRMTIGAHRQVKSTETTAV